MKSFYQALIQSFNKPENQMLFANAGIHPVRYIDLFADQYFNEENFDLFAQNAVLVDWDIDYGTDPATATINIHCCYEQLRDTSNISANRDTGLKFLDYVDIVDNIIRKIESAVTGKLHLFSEGFLKMDSIVDVYMLSYQCTFIGRNTDKDYQNGDYDTLDLKGNLVREITLDTPEPGLDYGLTT